MAQVLAQKIGHRAESSLIFSTGCCFLTFALLLLH